MIDMVESDDRWSVHGDELLVTSVCVDWAVRLTVGAEGSPFEVRVESPLVFTAPNGSSVELIPAENPEGLAPVLRLVRSRLERLDAFKDGRLELSLADGTHVRVSMSEEYEPWEIVGPRGFRIVSLPGGGISTWSAVAD